MSTLTSVILITVTYAISFNCAFEQNRVSSNRAQPFVTWNDVLVPSRTRTRSSALGHGIVPLYLQEIRNNIDNYDTPSDVDPPLSVRHRRDVNSTRNQNDNVDDSTTTKRTSISESDDGRSSSSSETTLPRSTSSSVGSVNNNNNPTDTGQGITTTTGSKSDETSGSKPSMPSNTHGHTDTGVTPLSSSTAQSTDNQTSHNTGKLETSTVPLETIDNAHMRSSTQSSNDPDDSTTQQWIIEDGYTTTLASADPSSSTNGTLKPSVVTNSTQSLSTTHSSVPSSSENDATTLAPHLSSNSNVSNTQNTILEVSTTHSFTDISHDSLENTTVVEQNGTSDTTMSILNNFNNSETTYDSPAFEINDSTIDPVQQNTTPTEMSTVEGSGGTFGGEEEEGSNTSMPTTIPNDIITTSDPVLGPPHGALVSKFPWLKEQDQIYVVAGVLGALILLLIIVVIRLSCQVSRMKKHCPLHYAVSESLLPLNSSPSIRPNEELAMRGFSQYNGHPGHPDRDGSFRGNMQGMDNFAYDEDPRIGKNASRKTFGGSSMY